MLVGDMEEGEPAGSDMTLLAIVARTKISNR